MVVATEFFDRRPRRDPAPARRWMMPKLYFTYRSPREVFAIEESSSKHEQAVPETKTAVQKKEESELLAAWETVELAYNTLRGRVMVCAECTAQQAEDLLVNLPGFLHLVRADRIAHTVLQKPYQQWSSNDRQYMKQALKSSRDAIDTLGTQVATWEQNPERVERLLEHIMTATRHGSQSYDNRVAWYRELMERRAFLRTHIKKALHKLNQLSTHTPREERVRTLLERFAPLEDFPHTIEDTEQATALQTLLSELEPIYTAIQSQIVVIRNPEEVVNVSYDLALIAVADEPQATNTVAEHKPSEDAQVWNDLVAAIQNIPSLGATTSISEPSADEYGQSEPSVAQLGTYRPQSGDALYEILSGETNVNELPILQLVSSTQRDNVISEVVETLDSAPALCLWIGLPYPATDLPNQIYDGNIYEIDLDKLHDLVTLIAVDQAAVTIPAARAQELAQLIKYVLDTYHNLIPTSLAEQTNQPDMLPTIESLGDLWPAFRSYFSKPQSSQSEEQPTPPPRVKRIEYTIPQTVRDRKSRIEEHVVNTIFNGSQQAFEHSMNTWAAQYLRANKVRSNFSRNNDEVCDVTEMLAPMQLDTLGRLLVASDEQRHWLRLHQIHPRDWKTIAAQIEQWQTEMKREGCYHPLLSFGECIQMAYALHMLDKLDHVE